MRAQALRVTGHAGLALDLEPFFALQRYLELTAPHAVEIPFAEVLAELVPPTAVRMRRDFRQLLTCIQTIALLHREQRPRTPDGAVVAAIADYTETRALLASVFDTSAAEGLTPAIRETVEAVAPGEEISATELSGRLSLSKSTVSWRTRRALRAGWLVNLESRKGHEARFMRGAPLPEDQSVLPSTEQVREMFECSNATEGESYPPPPSPGDGCGQPPASEAELEEVLF